ncbi:MAG: GatB/YqeY domain-containing protein [Candidatus Tokpelaia sp.]|nr:MAG: GatB/YqeY domain-containing protein [Candidatus Tokpelaia sp.]KAA6207386.1 MAG: GatB/YqeY domain-containing protein [Candidatus Tokpelaia sp.]
MENLKTAMKEQNRLRLSTLRLVNAAIKDRDIANRGIGRPVADDAEIQGLLARMIKQREESARLYEEAARPEPAAEERQEIAVIAAFLPRQLSDEEMQKAVNKALSDNEALSLRDMGRVMAQLKELYPGQMDFAKAGALVRKALQ